MMTEERGVDGVEVLTQLAQRDCFFGLDIGTHAGDLKNRRLAVEKCIEGLATGTLGRSAKTC